MALPRGSAQKDTDVRLGILFRWDAAPTDPYQVRQVEIIDIDGSTVLQTITTIEHAPGSGEYYGTASGAHLDQAGRYLDRWYYTWVNGEGEQTVTQDFYVQETSAPVHYGTDLQAGVGYLKGFPALAANAQDGITQADLDSAMAAADAMIESLFAADYDVSAWQGTPPALIALLWEMLAAAKAVEFKDLRLGLPGDDGESGAARLIRSARELIDKILHGWPERLHLRDSAGNLIRPRKNRTVTGPRAAEATSDLFASE
jgi:hypothetical protein